MNTNTIDSADSRLAESAPALLAALQALMNGAWPYMTAAQKDDALAAIEAATGEAL